MNKYLIAVIAISLVLIGFGLTQLDFSDADLDQSEDQPEETTQQEEEQKPKVSEEQLEKLSADKLLSEDKKYYIQRTTPFPKLVSVEDGTQYTVRPGAHYTKVTKLAWVDDKNLVFLYQVPDADYLNKDILNTVTVDEVVAQKFPNAGRVLSAADKIDYVLKGGRVYYYQLLNYDSTKRFYKNSTVSTYSPKNEAFDSPWRFRSDIYAYNVYSMELSPSADQVLLLLADLDAMGNTAGRKYVKTNLAGNVEETLEKYSSDWYND